MVSLFSFTPNVVALRVWASFHTAGVCDCSGKQSSWGQHGSHLGPVGPRWAPCWPHEPCYQGHAVALPHVQTTWCMVCDPHSRTLADWLILNHRNVSVCYVCTDLCINASGVEPGILRANSDSILAADVEAPCITGSPSTMVQCGAVKTWSIFTQILTKGSP